MTRKRFDVDVPDGQHLGMSRDTSGTYRGHLFDDDTNELVGHAELREVDEDYSSTTYVVVDNNPPPLSPAAQALQDALERVINHVIDEYVAPYLKRLFDERVVPAVATWYHDSRMKLSRFLAARRSDTPAVSVVDATLPAPDRKPLVEASADPSTEVVVAVQQYRETMSSDEAKALLVRAFMAELFRDEQIQRVMNARIVDEHSSGAIRTLTPEQIGAGVKRELEANPSLLDELAKKYWSSYVASVAAAPPIEHAEAPPGLDRGEAG